MTFKIFLKIIIISLCCTIIIEILLAYILKVKNKKDLLNVVLVNIATNPVLVSSSIYINIVYSLHYKNILIYPMELLVIILEGLIYKKYLNYKKINPFILSIILNFASYTIGLIINSLVY